MLTGQSRGSKAASFLLRGSLLYNQVGRHQDEADVSCDLVWHLSRDQDEQLAGIQELATIDPPKEMSVHGLRCATGVRLRYIVS